MFFFGLAVFIMTYFGNFATILIALFLIAYYIYTIANSIHNKLAENLRMNINKFNYAVGAIVLLRVIIYSISYYYYPEEIANSWLLSLVGTVSLFTAIGSLYILYLVDNYVTRLDHIHKIKTNEQITLTDGIINYLALVFFFPFGVWRIQPILRRGFLNETPELQN